MRQIQLNNSSLVALIDDADYEYLSQFKWSSLKSKTHHTTYAVRKTSTKGGLKMRSVLMHREVMGLAPADGKLVDHRNQNGLDNQRENLRITTKQINELNSSRPVKSLSGFLGVSERTGKGKTFAAKIKFNQTEILLGSFETVEEAAKAYDKKAIQLFAADARLNFPDDAKCVDCFHKLHRPGQCQHDDCGESEISHSRFEQDYVEGNQDLYYNPDVEF